MLHMHKNPSVKSLEHHKNSPCHGYTRHCRSLWGLKSLLLTLCIDQLLHFVLFAQRPKQRAHITILFTTNPWIITPMNIEASSLLDKIWKMSSLQWGWLTLLSSLKIDWKLKIMINIILQAFNIGDWFFSLITEEINVIFHQK